MTRDKTIQLPSKIGVVFGHVASNIGDLAINRGQIDLLRRAFPGAEIQVVFLNAENSEYLDVARSSLNEAAVVKLSYFRSHSRNALRYIADPAAFLGDCDLADADLVVLSAGEHIFFYKHGENLKSFFWRTLPAYAAKAAGKKCILLPSTLGPFEDAKSATLVRAMLGIVDGYAVRDACSAPLLRASVERDLAPRELLDPAFFIETGTASARMPSGPGKTVALVMRSDSWGIRLSADRRVDSPEAIVAGPSCRFASELCRHVLAHDDARVVVFVQTTADETLAGALLNDLRAAGHGERVSISHPRSINDYLRQLAQADTVVASRFHAIILGLIVGTPGIGVYFEQHGHKMPGLFQLLEVGERCFNLSSSDPAQVAEEAAELVRSMDGLGPALSGRLGELRAATVEFLRKCSARPLQVPQLLAASKAFGVFATDVALEGIDAANTKTLESARKAAAANADKLNKQIAGLNQRIVELEGELNSTASFYSRIKAEQAGEIDRLARALDAAKAEQESAAQAHARAEHAMDAELGRLRQMYAALQGEVEKVTQEREQAMRSSQAAEAQSREVVEALNSELEQAMQATAEMRGTIGRLQREAEVLRQETARQAAEYQRKVDHLHQTMAREVWRERDKWTSLLSYRAGNVLVEGAKHPLQWPALPFKLYREWRHFKADQQLRGNVVEDDRFGYEPMREPTPVRIDTAAESVHGEGLMEQADGPGSAPVGSHAAASSYESAFRDGGEEALVAMIQSESGGVTGRKLAMELLRRGKSFLHGGYEELEYPLAKAAMRIDASNGTLRGVFWAAQRAGDYALACDAILKIEESLGANRKEADLKALAQLKGSPAYQLSSLKLVEPRKPDYVHAPVATRICYVLHNSLPFSSGGYATRAHGVARGLSAQGHDVVCITRPGFPFDIKDDLDPATVETDAVIDGIRYMRIEQPFSKGITVPNYVRQSADELTRLFASLRPEVVIAASNYRIGVMALIAARRLGIPFIYEVRGWWELTRMSRDNDFINTPSYAIQSALEQAVAAEAEHVFTLTQPMLEALVDKGAKAAKVSLLPNSCDPSRFLPIERDAALAAVLGIPDGVPVIGYVGTFVDYEGLDDLAAACGILASRGVRFRLLLVGNENTSGQDRGPITSQIVEVAEREGFADCLIMPGRVPHEEVKSYYSLIDIAPFPRKPWPVCEMVSPMKPLEALAMEKAVVASDVRALAEMIRDGETGMLFRKGDVVSLADVLQHLMESPGIRAEMGKNGRHWVESTRTWSSVGARASTIVGKLVQARHE